MSTVRSARPPWPHDSRLSFRARGVLAWLIAHEGVPIESAVGGGTEQAAEIEAALAELERHGYLHRTAESSDVDEWGDLP